MSKPTNNRPTESNEPTSAAESGLTPDQRDGLACVVCGLDFTTSDTPSVPVGLSGAGQLFACSGCAPEPTPVAPASAMWPDGEPETVRDAARLNDLIERIAELAGQMFTLKFGQEAGAVGERLTRFIVCDAASDCRLDPDEVTALFMALKRGDLATVEEALTAR